MTAFAGPSVGTSIRSWRKDQICAKTPMRHHSCSQRNYIVTARAEKATKDISTIVSYVPKVRDVAPPPEETPIMHSTAYLVKGKAHTFDFNVDVSEDLDMSEQHIIDDFTGNALEWALHKADEQLNQMEHSNDGALKTARTIVKSPAGQITLRTMQGFATVAAAAGPQLLKVAVPIGKQLFKLGAQGLVGGVAALERGNTKPVKKSDE